MCLSENLDLKLKVFYFILLRNALVLTAGLYKRLFCFPTRFGTDDNEEQKIQTADCSAICGWSEENQIADQNSKTLRA